MRRTIKLNSPTADLGPWNLIFDPKDEEDEEEAKIEEVEKHVDEAHHELKLPRIEHPIKLHDGNLKLGKLALKLSQQSLELTVERTKAISARPRYDAMYGSTVGKSKNLRKQVGLSIQFPTSFDTIDSKSLDRQISTIQIGEPLGKQKSQPKQSRKLMNEQSAKKRSLLHFIKKVSLNDDLMRYYFENRNKRQK